MQINSQGRTVLQMQATNPLHFKKDLPQAEKTSEQSFADIFFKTINNVNSDQTASSALQQAAVISPDTVNVTDIMIAVEKARLSFGLLKGVTDRASRAFTDIMNIR